MSAIWPVEFNQPVRFTRQPFPRPRADIILMREEDHLRGLTHRQQRLEQIAFPSAVGSGHSIINDKRAGLAGPVAPERRCQAARGAAGKLLNKPPNPLESQLSQAAIKQVKYLLLKWPKHSPIYEAHYRT